MITTRDHIDGQRTVRLEGDEPREFAIVKGRRWTRVFEYMTNGQLTVRWFVDENEPEVRMAAGAKQVGRQRLVGPQRAFVFRILALPTLIEPPCWQKPTVVALRTKLADAIAGMGPGADTIRPELTLTDVQLIFVALTDLQPEGGG